MGITISDISARIRLATAYYVELLSKNTLLLQDGKAPKYLPQLRCLRMLILALSWDVTGNYLTETTICLYRQLLAEIANYSGSFLPLDPDVIIPGTTIEVIDEGNGIPPVDIKYSDMSLAGTRYDNPLWAGFNPFMEVDNTTQLYYPTDYTLLSTGGFILSPGGSVPAIFPGQIIRVFNYAKV